MAKPKESDIQRAIRMIEKLVLEGWSMPYSRKKACGADSTQLSKEVRKREAYLYILNNYAPGVHKNQHYKHDREGKIRGTKHSK